jgi:hypothetical protein
VISYEVYVIGKTDDKAVFENHIFVSELSTLVQSVDLESLTLKGIYAIAIRTKQVYDEETLYSDFAYSDNPEDADPVEGPFWIKFVPTGKPQRMKVQ